MSNQVPSIIYVPREIEQFAFYSIDIRWGDISGRHEMVTDNFGAKLFLVYSPDGLLMNLSIDVNYTDQVDLRPIPQPEQTLVELMIKEHMAKHGLAYRLLTDRRVI